MTITIAILITAGKHAKQDKSLAKLQSEGRRQEPGPLEVLGHDVSNCSLRQHPHVEFRV